MAAKPVLDADLLRRIDRDPETKQFGRFASSGTRCPCTCKRGNAGASTRPFARLAQARQQTWSAKSKTFWGLKRGRRAEPRQIWQFRFAPPDKRRPVLIVSRNALLERLHTATVVAITSTLRGSPTEVELGVDEGLKQPSCANLAKLFTVGQNELERYIGAVGAAKMRQVCRALVIACGCD